MINGFQNVANLTGGTGRELHTFEELVQWIEDRKRNRHVSISRVPLRECAPWYYDGDSGMIRNTAGSFFQIAGMRCEYPDGTAAEQPIILQKEIGYLGIICKPIHGIWHFLMQAKIEPGNINYVQISPTIQATKSNFTRRHGGKEPPYLHYFTEVKPENVLADQIQSEQSSRFFGKRNRNVIIRTEDDIPETDSHKWMTLSQLRQFMTMDNFINMDTRTVLSCIPYVFLTDDLCGYPEEFMNSIRVVDRTTMRDLYIRANDYKMFRAGETFFLPLTALKDWEMREEELVHRTGWPFKVIYCSLEIEGREVTQWNQPLFAAQGDATFGLLCSKSSGTLEILVQLKPETGCFDSVEIGPTVQEEYGSREARDPVAELFFERLGEPEHTVIDVVLSEEGGRFYHEQNRNVILTVDKAAVQYDPSRYVWSSIGTLNAMTMINNCLNIQLRNLLTLLYLVVSD